jgi:alcohol dehydrogenase class IV
LIEIASAPDVWLGDRPTVVSRLLAWLVERSVSSALVLVDDGAANTEPIRATVDRISTAISLEVHVSAYSEPSVDKVERLVEQASASMPDCVVAIGGGSTIDIGKLAALKLTNPRFVLPSQFLPSVSLRARPLPVVAVPTTCGTGSEVSPAAVYSGDHGKTALVHRLLAPTAAFVIPEFVLTVPRRYLVSGVGDAVVHSIEGLLSRRAVLLSDALHAKALNELYAVVPSAVAEGLGPSLADRLARAGLASGLGARIAGANLAHALASPIADQYAIPHGESTVLSCRAMLAFYWSSCATAKGRLTRQLHWREPLKKLDRLLGAMQVPEPWMSPGAAVPNMSTWIEKAASATNQIADSWCRPGWDDIERIYSLLVDRDENHPG